MYRTMTGTAALILMGLAACAPEGSDRGLISEPSFTVGIVGSCNFKAAKDFTKAYFNVADRRTAWTLIGVMEKAGAGSPAANDAGFEVFKLIASVRDGGTAVGTPANAADATIAVINCMDVTVTDLTDFRTTLTGALDHGAYAVRGETSGPEAPVITANGESGVYPEDGDFLEFIGGRGLVYGAQVNSAFTEDVIGQTYRWGMVHDATTTGPSPTPEDDDAITVAFCTQLDDLDIARVGRKSTAGAQAVLGLALDLDWLPCAAIGAQSPTGLLSRVLAMVMPRPLQASALLFGNTGGLAGGFSDFGVVNPGAVVLEWVTQPPTTGLTDTPFPVVVSAKAANGTPLEHVSITLTVDGNQGTTVVLTGGGPELTGENGLAEFMVSINKTGGYTLRATATFSGFDDVYILSNLFNLSKP